MDREAVRDGILDAVYVIALAGGVAYVLFEYVLTRDNLFWVLGFLPAPIRENPWTALFWAVVVLGLIGQAIEKIREMRRP